MINKNNHVFLICETKFSNTNELIKEICKSFFHGIKNEDLFRKKIDNNNYYDYIEYNLYFDDLKINQIIELKKRFFSIALESSEYKFYVLRNVEFLSNKIANSLLKFIENPPHKTIAIFTTRNINKVLPTIHSRCEEIKTKSNIREINEWFKLNNILHLKDFYLNSFFSFEEIKIFNNSINKTNIINLYENIRNDKNNKLNLLNHLEKFKKLSNKEISILINGLAINCEIENKKKILELSNNLKYNLNKSLVFNQILDLI